MTTSDDTPATPAQRLDRLLGAEAESFLREAYLLLLGRSLDAGGERFYAARLRSGARRDELLRELAHSDEGRRHLAGDAALAAAVAQRVGERPNVAANVDALLALSDRDFVEQVFVAVLGTPGDARSHALLDAQLRGGMPRVRVLEELAAARRPQRPGTTLAGLDELLARLRDPAQPVARDVRELMSLHDEAFVDSAYRMLFGRAPDAAGLHHYGGQLSEGRSRHGVLAELASSSEARARGPQPPGVGRLVATRHWVRLPLLGPVVAWITGVESESGSARRKRMLQALMRRSYRLESRLAGAPAGSAGGGAGVSASARSLNQLEADFLARLEAMLDIQRDGFDREMNAIRKLVLQRETRGQEAARVPTARRGRR